MSSDFATGCSKRRVFVIGDLHLGDERVAKGRQFACASAMGTEIASNWNATLRHSDRVYVLGDVATRNHIPAISKLNGEKHLIAGNADDLGAVQRSGIFARVLIARRVQGFLLTHNPVHPSQLGSGVINVHGHLHAATIPNLRYRCVSVEHTAYAPVVLESLRLARRATH